MASSVETAFVLGAGRGTRLRPLTEDWPKPLLPLAGRPMITHAFDHLIAQGVRRLIVNTHHAAHRYAEVFPDRSWRGVPITFVHEPVLLDTGGGLKNIQPLLAPDESIIVYNGDIYTDLPLSPLMEAHQAAPVPATLVLRRRGEPRNVSLAPDGTICDLRHLLGNPGTPCLFAGIYVATPALFDVIPPGVPFSLIDALLQLIREGRPPRGVVINQGHWHDLGTVAEYQQLNSSHCP